MHLFYFWAGVVGTSRWCLVSLALILAVLGQSGLMVWSRGGGVVVRILQCYMGHLVPETILAKATLIIFQGWSSEHSLGAWGPLGLYLAFPWELFWFKKFNWIQLYARQITTVLFPWPLCIYFYSNTTL